MPKLVDYAVRFDFLREGAFEVVLRHGVAALSRRAVADALGTSVNTDATVSALVHDAVDLLGSGVDRVECERDLRTQLSGLTLGVCLGELTPDEAVAALTRTVQRWCPARVTE
ncbi:hypothetical protein [Nocardioides sp. GXQ0305]|uniref:hypothetical protein n=1 Tax=Nocardioides sp. GXQ0305 TaxID=3423912 RepID=UPI003D7EFA13